jgi:hypothetical protein
MGFDYARMAAMAERLLRRFGTTVPVTFMAKDADATYNPASGQVSFGFLNEPYQIKYDTPAILLDYEQKDVDGTLVKLGDQKVYLPSSLPVTPKTGDVLVIPIYEGGQIVSYDEFEIITSKPLAPAGIIVMHEVQARKD